MIIRQLETVWAPRMLSVLRIVAALLFMEHGTQKLLGFPPSSNPGPALLSLSGIAGVLELFGGALLAAGLFTRPVAFILSGEMAFAYWIAHAPRSFFPILNGGDAAILYCFVFLYLASRAAVPGAWMRREKPRRRGLPEAEGHQSPRAGKIRGKNMIVPICGTRAAGEPFCGPSVRCRAAQHISASRG